MDGICNNDVDNGGSETNVSMGYIVIYSIATMEKQLKLVEE